MFKRFFHKNCNPLRNRFVACAAVGLYIATFAAITALDEYAYCIEPCLECFDDDREFEPPSPEKTDPLCEFLRLSVPFFMADVPLLLQTGIGSKNSFPILIPSVADATILPPCRAPPAF